MKTRFNRVMRMHATYAVAFIVQLINSFATCVLLTSTNNITTFQRPVNSLLSNWKSFCRAGFCSPAHKSLLPNVIPTTRLEAAGSIPLDDDTDDECKRAIELYAVYAANFTYCTVKFARPITFCEECVEYHDRAEHEMMVLKALSNTHHNKHNSSRSCHDIMTNSDRIHLLEQSDQFISSVWSQSNCDRCFNNHSIDSAGQFTFAQSSDLRLFTKLHTEATECFVQYGTDFVVHNDSYRTNRSAACVNCSAEYSRLNTFYVDLEHAAEMSGLCMDMIDLIINPKDRISVVKNIEQRFSLRKPNLSYPPCINVQMNYTRQTWSNVFQCKSQRLNDPALLAISLFLALFAFTFYVSSKIQTGFKAYRVRKQQRLTPQQIEESAAAASAVAATASSYGSSRTARGISADPRYIQPRRPNPAGFDVFGHSYDFGSDEASTSMYDASSSMAFAHNSSFVGDVHAEADETGSTATDMYAEPQHQRNRQRRNSLGL